MDRSGELLIAGWVLLMRDILVAVGGYVSGQPASAQLLLTSLGNIVFPVRHMHGFKVLTYFLYLDWTKLTSLPVFRGTRQSVV